MIDLGRRWPKLIARDPRTQLDCWVWIAGSQLLIISYRTDSTAEAALSPTHCARDTVSPAWSTGPPSFCRGTGATGDPVPRAIGTFLRRSAAYARPQSSSLQAPSAAVPDLPDRRN